MHPAARTWVEHCLGDVDVTGATVVEIGGRDLNGGVRDLFDGCGRYTSVDLFDGPGVDIVADASTWQPPAPVDIVVCCEVLEHTAVADQVVVNAASWLRPRGALIVTCATDPRAPHSGIEATGIHPGEFYENISPARLERLLEVCMSTWRIDVAGEDLRAVGVA